MSKKCNHVNVRLMHPLPDDWRCQEPDCEAAFDLVANMDGEIEEAVENATRAIMADLDNAESELLELRCDAAVWKEGFFEVIRQMVRR